MPTQIAVLRAVNVGGRSIAMAALRDLLTEQGLEDVRTVLQSGNAVFGTRRAPASVERGLEKAIADRFGIASDVFVRTSSEWDTAIASNPFEKEAKDDPAHVVLLALKDAPDDDAVAELRAAIPGRERVAVVGRHAYLVYPDGIGSSKLTMPFLESRLGTRGTGRNFNTARKIAALANARS